MKNLHKWDFYYLKDLKTLWQKKKLLLMSKFYFWWHNVLKSSECIYMWERVNPFWKQWHKKKFLLLPQCFPLLGFPFNNRDFLFFDKISRLLQNCHMRERVKVYEEYTKYLFLFSIWYFHPFTLIDVSADQKSYQPSYEKICQKYRPGSA